MFSECGAAGLVAGPAGGLVLPAQVWLSGVSLDGLRDQQARAGPEGQRRCAGGGRTRGVWAEGVRGRRVFERM